MLGFAEMSGPGPKPQGQGDLVEIAPSTRPLHVSFEPPEPSEAMRARPLRFAMFWIFALVLLGLFWSCFGENTPERTPPAVRASGTTHL